MLTWGDSKKGLEDLGWTPYQEASRWRRRCILAWIHPGGGSHSVEDFMTEPTIETRYTATTKGKECKECHAEPRMLFIPKGSSDTYCGRCIDRHLEAKRV